MGSVIFCKFKYTFSSYAFCLFKFMLESDNALSLELCLKCYFLFNLGKLFKEESVFVLIEED